jgi:hypothetical protein
MLAVVVQKVITALAQPGARPSYDIASAGLVRSLAELNGPISNEVFERDFLDAAPPIPGEPGVMDDAATAGIDSMMPISAPEHDQRSSWHTLTTQVRGSHVSLPG